MPTTTLDIIDSAVKIGLGALISGFATYQVGKFNHKKDLLKSRIARERELVEHISGQIEIFSSKTLIYWAYMVELVNTRIRKKPETADLTERIEKAASELFDSFNELTSAEGKLILLGADECQNSLREYGDCVKSFRKTIWVGNVGITIEEMESFRTEIYNKRLAALRKLKELYAGERT